MTTITPVESTSAPLAAASAPPTVASTSQTDNRPILRFSDIACAVRLSRTGQADLVADSLLAGFRTERMRPQLIFAVHAMFALLCDVGAFLREHVVMVRLASEPAQGVLDDISSSLDHLMGDDEHHQLA